MPGTIKLGSADHRAWRMNRAHWVTPQGQIVRAVEQGEEEAISQAKRKVRIVGKSGSVHIGPVKGNERGAKRLVQFEVVKTGPRADAFVIETYLNGDRYVKGRDIITARIISQHGECILLGTNGKRLTVARDQRKVQAMADARARSGGGRGGHTVNHLSDILHERGLDPELADRRTPKLSGSHHIHHRRLSRDRTVKASSRVIAGATLDPNPADVARDAEGRVMSGTEANFRAHTRRPQAAARRAPGIKLSDEFFSPTDCPNNCRGFADGTNGWSWPAAVPQRGDMHHPTCAHAGAWKRQAEPGPVKVLYDLDRRRELRPASDIEVAESEKHASKFGTPAITIASRQYAVIEQGAFDLSEQELELATPAQQHGQARQQQLRQRAAVTAQATAAPTAAPTEPAPPAHPEPVPQMANLEANPEATPATADTHTASRSQIYPGALPLDPLPLDLSGELGAEIEPEPEQDPHAGLAEFDAEQETGATAAEMRHEEITPEEQHLLNQLPHPQPQNGQQLRHIEERNAAWLMFCQREETEPQVTAHIQQSLSDPFSEECRATVSAILSLQSAEVAPAAADRIDPVHPVHPAHPVHPVHPVDPVDPVDYDQQLNSAPPRPHRVATRLPAQVSPQGVIANTDDPQAAAIIAQPAVPYQGPCQ